MRGVNSCDSGTLPVKGRDSSVLTVPGCNATTTESGAIRVCSIAIVLASILSAAFDMR